MENIINLQEESKRCLLCKNARCKANCPISTEIPRVIELYKEGNLEEAGKILFENNPLSLICAIVCPHEVQCLGNCIRGIKGEPVHFHKIEEEISQKYLEDTKFVQDTKNNKKIGIIGSGPAGITIALILAKKGYDVTLFEKYEKIGGVLRYGIPEFRLHKSLIDLFEKKLLELNVKIRPNTVIGPVITLDTLFEDGYKAIFIGTGVWNPRPLRIKGESLGNVHYAIDYLRSPSVYNLGHKVCVIGAGNVAMDAARSALRNGAEEVVVLCRRGFESISAIQSEVEGAKEEGVKFEMFKAPVEILDEGIKYVDTAIYLDENGNEVLSKVEGSEKILKCDSTIIAISQLPKNTIIASTTGLQISKHGLLLTDEIGHTTKKGVFASGDVVTGAKTVIKAVVHAKEVAEAMDDYCRNDEN